ncbi:MAG: hypothetical protein H8E34_03065 [Bacteroidetes bacterium]|nr:hypothetical protein [Bacteroidota bacterium]MBL6942915.1 hypothetical protein [Bacteroidales bacterium]
MHKYFIISFTFTLLVFTCSLNSLASGDLYPIGSRSAGMGRTSVAITDFWGAMNNQAGIALFNKPAVGVYYENHFLLNELSTKSVAGIVPTKFGVFGITYNHFGYRLYNNQKVGIVYARAFGNNLRIGLQLDYLQTALGNNYGKKGNVTFELGIQTDITEKITIGVWVFNPTMVVLADYDNEKLPAVYRLGFVWHISDIFLATVEAEKSTDINSVMFRGGLEYELNKRFFFRTGFSTRKEIFSFGFGMKFKHIVFNLSAIMHESLGFSPQTSLIFQF